MALGDGTRLSELANNWLRSTISRCWSSWWKFSLKSTVHEKWRPHRNCIWSRKWHSSGLELGSSARGPGRPTEIKQIEVPAKIRFCRISSWGIGKGSWINIPQHSSERSPYACIGCIGIAWYSSQKMKPYCRASLTTFGKVKRLHESHQHGATAANHHILQCYGPNPFQKTQAILTFISSYFICCYLHW